MPAKTRRTDAGYFIEAWGPDMANLLLEAVPELRRAAPQIIDTQAGFHLTAPRGPLAVHPWPLNVFLLLSPLGLSGFFRDDLAGYARFTAALHSLPAFCAAFDVDIPGGSQRVARMQRISIDTFMLPMGR